MHLYLSSYHLGNDPSQLKNLVGKNTRAAVISNSLDFSLDHDRKRKSIQREIADLNNLGFISEELDLKNYFGKAPELEAKMEEFGLVWVIGGNTFILRRAMAESGLDKILLHYTHLQSKQDFIYAGYSAGVCVLSPTLKGIELADDPHFIPEGYQQQTLYDGLGIINYFVAPHYKSYHPESDLTDKTVEYYIEHKMLFKILRDGEALVERT